MVTGSSISSSDFEGDNKVLRSRVSGSDISFGVDVIDSEVYNVMINEDKNNNYCFEDNIDEPEFDENMNPNYCFIPRDWEDNL